MVSRKVYSKKCQAVTNRQQLTEPEPFGSIYNMKTLVDSSLQTQEDIVFRAGSHEKTLKMRYDDYVKVESPTVGSFAIE